MGFFVFERKIDIDVVEVSSGILTFGDEYQIGGLFVWDVILNHGR